MVILCVGRVFGCGRNHDSTLGFGHTKITVVPKPVEKLDDTIVDNIVAGVAMSVFISRQGHAYWCGQGIGGLGKVSNEYKTFTYFHRNLFLFTVQQTAIVPTKLNFPERLKTVSIGDDHMIIQTRLCTLHFYLYFITCTIISIELEDYLVWGPTLGDRLVTIQMD